jgi:hypothetical protein
MRAPRGQISGFNLTSQEIDLGGYAYSTSETVSWTEAPSNTSGTLTVTDGAKVANLTLLGSYVTSNFDLSTDSQGGTLVTDPPVAAARFAQAMAAFDTLPPASSMLSQSSIHSSEMIPGLKFTADGRARGV